MKIIPTICIFIIFCFSAESNASCWFGNVIDQKIDIEVVQAGRDIYQVKVIVPAQYKSATLEMISISRDKPYLRFDLAVFPNGLVDDTLESGKSFVSNKEVPSTEKLLSYAAFYVSNLAEISNYVATVNYGPHNCPHYFGEPLQLKYNQAQPSAAGDAAKDAP